MNKWWKKLKQTLSDMMEEAENDCSPVEGNIADITATTLWNVIEVMDDIEVEEQEMREMEDIEEGDEDD